MFNIQYCTCILIVIWMRICFFNFKKRICQILYEGICTIQFVLYSNLYYSYMIQSGYMIANFFFLVWIWLKFLFVFLLPIMNLTEISIRFLLPSMNLTEISIRFFIAKYEFDWITLYRCRWGQSVWKRRESRRCPSSSPQQRHDAGRPVRAPGGPGCHLQLLLSAEKSNQEEGGN